jgi:ATP phosphoribosyltransferase regulatory subunit HisZ
MTETQSCVPLTEEDHIAIFGAVTGLARWTDDAAKLVARAIRQGELTSLQRISLAMLFDGTHPKRLKLSMHGQGNDETVEEAARHYDRVMKVGPFVQARIDAGEKPRDAYIDAEAPFQISDSTAKRDYLSWRDITGRGPAEN